MERGASFCLFGVVLLIISHGGNQCQICWRLPQEGGGKSVLTWRFIEAALVVAKWHHKTIVVEIVFLS